MPCAALKKPPRGRARLIYIFNADGPDNTRGREKRGRMSRIPRDAETKRCRKKETGVPKPKLKRARTRSADGGGNHLDSRRIPSSCCFLRPRIRGENLRLPRSGTIVASTHEHGILENAQGNRIERIDDT